MKVDIIAFGAHPDDVELGCGGSISSAISQGLKVGIVAWELYQKLEIERSEKALNSWSYFS